MKYLHLLIGVLVISTAHAYTGDELTEMLRTGLGNVLRETINGDATLEKGTIPKWLSGTHFIIFIIF